MPLSLLIELERTGRYVVAQEEFLRCLNDPAINSPKQLAQVYFLGARCRHALQNTRGAIELTQLAEEYALKAGDCDTLGKTWFNRVEYMRITGDISHALDYAKRFLGNVDLYPSLAPFVGACMFNVALCLRQRQDIDGAIRSYLDAANDSEQTGNLGVAITARQNAAFHLYELERPDEGDAELAKATALLDDDNVVGRRKNLLVRAYSNLVAKDYEQARLTAMELIAPGVEPTDEERFFAYWLIGEAYAGVGHNGYARTFLELATNIAIAIGDPRHMNRCNALRVALLQRQ